MISIPSPRSKRRARIEIIPLIDIIFFLLATFVMVSLSMIKNQGIPLHLPSASTGSSQSRGQSGTISIAPEGTLFFNKQPVALADLPAVLGQWKTTNSDPRVFIQGDKKAEFGVAIAVLDVVRRCGLTNIAIETEAKSAP